MRERTEPQPLNDHVPTQLCQRRGRDEEEAHSAREVPRRDGADRALGEADRSDRAAVPEERARRPPARRRAEDAAHVLLAAVVRHEALEDALYDSQAPTNI